jgi:hypothetical protein
MWRGRENLGVRVGGVHRLGGGKGVIHTSVGSRHIMFSRSTECQEKRKHDRSAPHHFLPAPRSPPRSHETRTCVASCVCGNRAPATRDIISAVLGLETAMFFAASVQPPPPLQTDCTLAAKDSKLISLAQNPIAVLISSWQCDMRRYYSIYSFQ